ncbi:KilA-N domain-containing protein [Kingella potus]|uniref:KilA-N domain-containing protein n=1 Tax=Kingella potus TaxID=265175 RepID=UPI001FD0A3B3|nr:KilA-N domain-containing protein [Kingella potus]UOP00569.1 KilA-N domain-containing protein [Kingella potus]
MNSICISNVAIRQTSNNLYNLNDLHKASGGEKRFQPANWLRNAQTVDLIDFLKNEELQSEGKIIQSKQGLGTFVCKELVYAYATWISAKFFLLVIRTFDAVVTGRLKTESRTTSDERTALRQAVSALVGLRRVDYSTAYNMVHQRFGVEKIEDLPRETLPDAVRYVHALTLDNALTGEVLEKIDRPSEKQFSADEIHAIGVCAKYLADCSAFLYPLSDSLRGLGSRFSAVLFRWRRSRTFGWIRCSGLWLG